MQRPTKQQRGYGNGWDKLSKMKLIADPLCEDCGEVAVDVHHVDGDTGNRKGSNLRSLCRMCHNMITHRRGRG